MYSQDRSANPRVIKVVAGPASPIPKTLCATNILLMEILIKDRKSPGFISVALVNGEIHEEWLVAEAFFQLNGFSAKFEFSLMLAELIVFFQELKTLNETLKGVAHLKNIEDNIDLTFGIDELGHVHVNGILRDNTYTIKTTFLLETDQTYLTGILKECRQIFSELKVVVD